MSSNNSFKLFAALLVTVLVLSLAAPMVLAEGTQSGPDVSVIVGATGSTVSRANVYLDGSLAGTTDLKGNFTFKEAPAAGNHTIMVSGKGINNATVSTDFSSKPVVVDTVQSYPGKNFTIHIADKNKNGLANASVYNGYKGNYLIGTTNATGDISLTNFPGGLYLVKIQKDGYRTTTTLLIVYSNATRNFTLSPK